MHARNSQPPRGHFCIDESIDSSRTVKSEFHVGLWDPEFAGWVEADLEAMGYATP